MVSTAVRGPYGRLNLIRKAASRPVLIVESLLLFPELLPC